MIGSPEDLLQQYPATGPKSPSLRGFRMVAYECAGYGTPASPWVRAIRGATKNAKGSLMGGWLAVNGNRDSDVDREQQPPAFECMAKERRHTGLCGTNNGKCGKPACVCGKCYATIMIERNNALGRLDDAIEFMREARTMLSGPYTDKQICDELRKLIMEMTDYGDTSRADGSGDEETDGEGGCTGEAD